MAFGLDIKHVLQEVGTAVHIKGRTSGETDIDGGYLDYEMNRQVTKPFVREFFLEASLPYDTVILAGDVVEFQDGTSRRFMVMNKTPENFENEGVIYEIVLHRCNVSGELFRPSGEVPNATTYQRQTVWQLVRGECYGLLTDRLFGTDLIQDEELGQIGIESQVLYLPHSVGARVLDRYRPVSGEYYKIETVSIRRYDNIDICYVSEDTRE